MPTVSSPADTASGIRSDFGKMSVMGPGQYAFMSRRAAAGISPLMSGGISSTRETWTISGLSPGRPFAAKIVLTASAFRAFAPSPYTVSVGKPTRPPARIIAAA